MLVRYVNFYGLKLSIIDERIFLESIVNAIATKDKLICYGYSFGSINLMRKYHQIYELGNIAEIMLVDGRPLYLLCRLFKLPLISDISIPQAVYYILSLANQYGYKILLLGATEKDNSLACKLIRLKYKNIKSVHGIHGYFQENEECMILDQINSTSSDILLIGMSSPKKEQFVLRNRDKVNTKILVPCGGMIDVLAEKTKVTPKMIKKLCLASFYRLIQEPNRLFIRQLKCYLYILTFFIPIFFYNVIIKKNVRFNIPKILKIKI